MNRAYMQEKDIRRRIAMIFLETCLGKKEKLKNRCSNLLEKILKALY